MKWLKYGLVGIVAVLALGVAVLLAMGQRSGRGRMVSTVEIARPPEAVWLWINDPERFRQWVSWTEQVRDSGAKGVGARRLIRMRDPNMNNQAVEVESVVREEEIPKRLVVDVSSKLGFTGRLTYSLEDLGQGRTRLTSDGRFEYEHWFARLLEPLVTPQAQAKAVADFGTLKRLAEQESR